MYTRIEIAIRRAIPTGGVPLHIPCRLAAWLPAVARVDEAPDWVRKGAFEIGDTLSGIGNTMLRPGLPPFLCALCVDMFAYLPVGSHIVRSAFAP